LNAQVNKIFVFMAVCDRVYKTVATGGALRIVITQIFRVPREALLLRRSDEEVRTPI
jgi:hypothetical protein